MPTASATPVALLAAWEATATPIQVAAQLPYQPSVLAWLTKVAAFPHSDINVNLDDARTVLHGARAVRAAQASARGEGRIAAVLRQLLAGLPTSRLAQRSLLSIRSSPVHELEMDELSELTKIIYATLLGSQGELIFGHGSLPEPATGGIQVWLLAGYDTIS